jgi:hypothetical protein
MFDSEVGSELLSASEGGRTISTNALVDAQGHDANGRTAGKMPVREFEGGGRIFSSRDRDRDRSLLEARELLVHLPSNAFANGFNEVGCTQVCIPVGLIDGGDRRAPVTLHNFAHIDALFEKRPLPDVPLRVNH